MVLKRFGYIFNVYTTLLSYALKRSRFTRSDISGLMFMFVAPLLYGLGVKKIKTPIGLLITTDREAFRSFVYGFFKTYFYYGKDLTALLGNLHFAVIVDVGANIGDFALGTANMADTIVCIEPGEQNFKALQANLNANEIENALPLNIAATNNNKKVYLQGNTSDMFVTTDRRGEVIDGYTLDYILEKYLIRSIDLIKLDVQGHELFVLSGMHQLLSKKLVNFLIVEVHLKRGVDTDDVIRQMTKYGYDVVHRDDFLFEQPHLYFKPHKKR